MYLAIDIGGTYTKYGYYQSSGICLQKNMIPTVKTNKETFYHALKTLITKEVEGIAISMKQIFVKNFPV